MLGRVISWFVLEGCYIHTYILCMLSWVSRALTHLQQLALHLQLQLAQLLLRDLDIVGGEIKVRELLRQHNIHTYIHTYIYLSLVRCRTSSVFSEKIFVYLFSGE